ncbi:MAG: hypothetical protein QOJ59_2232 [Thermomicrobiales bacterium]|nr:hypothetical protein [Thermomicrobiales bacterium]
MVQSTTLPSLVRGEWVPMSYEEFLAWVPDGLHGEWFDGEGIIFVPPTKDHQDAALFLAELIATFARVFGLGEVVIAPYEMRLREGAPGTGRALCRAGARRSLARQSLGRSGRLRRRVHLGRQRRSRPATEVRGV